MPDEIVPAVTSAAEVPAAPEAAPTAEVENSAAAPGLADPDAQAPATEGVDAGSPTASDQGKRKPAGDRIQELVADKQALREAAEFWRERALINQTPAPAPTPTPAAKATPTLEEFEFDTSRWAAAHAKWADEQIELRTATAVDQRLHRREAEQAQAAVEQSWSQRIEELSKTEPGAVDTITVAGRIVSPFMGQLIKASEKGPQIAVHLGLNPDKAARIARLPEAQQAVHIGRLEAEVSAPAPAKPKSQPSTRAPAPPTPVGGNAPSKPMEAMSIDEYLADRAHRRKLTRA